MRQGRDITIPEWLLWRRRFFLWVCDHPGSSRSSLSSWEAFARSVEDQPPSASSIMRWFGSTWAFTHGSELELERLAASRGYGAHVHRRT